MATGTSSQNAALPTISEIEAATESLNMHDSSARVVRVNGFAVKFGNSVPLSEADNMRFVAANSHISVPEVYDAFTDNATNKTYIIMKHFPGDDLQKLLPTLTPAEKATICKRVKETIDELRSIPPPGYLGTINHQPYIDGVFWTSDQNPAISGPFPTQAAMNDGIIKRLSQTESPQYIRLLRRMVDDTLYGHRTVFTHGDLQPKNIIVERLSQDGENDFKITLIDWETAGWYPEYWEFCNATIACRFKPDWLELVPDILEHYSKEYLMMQTVYHTVYY